MTEDDRPLDEKRADSRRWHLSDLAERVSNRAYKLQADYQRDVPSAVAALARLRGAVGTAPGDDPAAWAETLAVIGDDLGRGDDEPTTREWAAHLSLTLFALHQQSHRESGMHRGGQSFGQAVRRLSDAYGGEDDSESKPVLRKFHAIATADGLEELSHHARGLISQFRAKGIALDYGQFTDDLVALQDPRRAPSVRLAWGRAFYRIPAKTSTTSNDITTEADKETSND